MIGGVELYNKISDWTRDAYGPDFRYRMGQQESVYNIINDWFNLNHKGVILDAPTGSGKSIIAMTVAGVLADCFGKSGYILISDLSLLEQYAQDVERYFPEWSVIKGQDNYNCLENGLPFKLGVCRLEGCKSYHDIETRFSECSEYCEYLVCRHKSLKAKIVVCTYSFWLIHRNMGEDASYPEKDFVICDEAHKVTDIVQSHFSPSISDADLLRIKHLSELIDIYDDGDIDIIRIDSLYEEMKATNDKKRLFNLIQEYADIIKDISDKMEKLTDAPDKKRKTSTNELLKNSDWIKEQAGEFGDYIYLIESCGVSNIIKNPSAAGKSITFNSIDETYLMRSRFIKKCKKFLFMSATIGEPNAFACNAKIEDFTAYKMENTFDYTNSPIYLVDEYKMSYAEKDRSFPYLLEMVINIIRMYPGRRGIIQTGSYELTKRLYESLPSDVYSRSLVYYSSSEKQGMIDEYKYSTDKVLIGPTLLEGLSLDDDLCRFQIIFKIPYPSLKDAFVAAKKEESSEWYLNKTIISLLQGVGRGIRNEHDWCVTFILDACFSGMYRNAPVMFPPEFLQRIQVIPASTLMKK